MNPLIVIPTYNERKNLEALVPRIFRVLPHASILVVDDASSDGTARSALRLGRKYGGRIRVISRPGKLGLGSAYIRGFQHALESGSHDPIIQMDADGSHDPASLRDFLQAFRKADVVVGSRYLDGVRVMNWTWYRLLLSCSANWYARLVTGMPVTDLTGGFNGWRRHVLERAGLGRLRCSGYAFQIELKHAAWRAGARVREVPIVFAGRVEGESKMSRTVVLEAILAVWRMRLRALLRLRG